MKKEHSHTEHSHVEGLFRCECGAVRLSPGEWANSRSSRQIARAAQTTTRKLVAKYGTSVDAYGQRL